ncbi:hypothetical protein [Bradyrhizobium elkanii]|nr:hypothetical protein [Bradyrhizobium elkanii]MCP1970827.1 hypothetical protein [Bradyrhizobium elkanii]MCS4107666.1 hypothetical protein [Bradyrhizobium elkanii]
MSDKAAWFLEQVKAARAAKAKGQVEAEAWLRIADEWLLLALAAENARKP